MCLLCMCGGTAHCTCVYMPVHARGGFQEPLLILSTLCLETVSLLGPGAHQFGKNSTGEFQEPCGLCLPSLRISGTHYNAQLFMPGVFMLRAST